MSDAGAARALVADRLQRLFGEWREHQAIQFRGGWWSWADVGRVHTALGSVLDEQRVPTSAAVAVVMRQRPDCVGILFAAFADGRCAVQISPIQADRVLADDIAQLRPAVLVATGDDWARPGVAEAAGAAAALGLELTGDLSDPLVVRTAPDRVHPGPDLDAAITVLTSGTTGPPKRLPVSWQSVVAMGDGTRAREPRPGRGAVILTLPLVTLGGLISITRTLFGGRPMALMERFDVWEWAELVKQHRPRVLGAPPPAIQMILDAGIPRDYFEHATSFRTASAPVDVAVARAFHERYGIPVLQGYGATEFLDSVTGWTDELWDEFGAAKLGSVGRALPGVRLQVVDPDTGAVLPAGAEGILEVDPALRADHLPEGWLRTADRARIDDEGFLWILGRADDIIIRGGFKVDLTRVEAALAEHPDVADASAVGLPDARLGQVPGVVVTAGGERRPSEAELIAWVRDRLPAYAVPTVIRIVDEIPRTPTLKKHKARIRQLLSDG